MMAYDKDIDTGGEDDSHVLIYNQQKLFEEGKELVIKLEMALGIVQNNMVLTKDQFYNCTDSNNALLRDISDWNSSVFAIGHTNSISAKQAAELQEEMDSNCGLLLNNPLKDG